MTPSLILRAASVGNSHINDLKEALECEVDSCICTLAGRKDTPCRGSANIISIYTQ